MGASAVVVAWKPRKGSELIGVAGQVFLHHQRYLEHDGVLELPQVQPGDLLDLLQAVDQSVPVHEQLPGGLGDVQVVLEEPLDGEQGLMVQGVDGPPAEDLLQEHLAQGGGQLVDQPGNAQMIVADDGLLRVEDLSHLQGHLGFLEGAGQVLDGVDHCADTHGAVGVELPGEGIHDGAGQLVDILLVDIGLDLLDQGDIRLVDIDDEILVLVREQVLQHVVGGDIILLGDLDQHAHPAHVKVEVQLMGFQIDVPGQDVVQDHVLDEVAPVVFLVVVLLDVIQRHGQDAHELGGLRVGALHEHGILRPGLSPEGLEGVPPGEEDLAVGELLRGDPLADLPNPPQLTAGNDHRRLVNDAQRPVDGIPHLMDDPLKQTIGHNATPFCCQRPDTGPSIYSVILQFFCSNFNLFLSEPSAMV